MTSNVTSLNTTTTDSKALLLLPYIGLAVACVVFLAINFWCYHRKHRLRYRRKAEVLETRQRVRERRIILSIVKAKYRTRLQQEQEEKLQLNMFYANPITSDSMRCPEKVAVDKSLTFHSHHLYTNPNSCNVPIEELVDGIENNISSCETKMLYASPNICPEDGHGVML